MPTDTRTAIPPEQLKVRAKCHHPTGTFQPFPAEAIESSIVARFEEQVRRRGNRPAIRTRRRSLTYDELNLFAHKIASALLERTSSSERPVALLFDHDALAIVAMLGTLKAGKMYVPLDPAYPRQRLEFVLRDSTACLLLTEFGHLSFARSIADGRMPVLDIEAIDDASALEDTLIDADTPAFIIYTSGSTGQPKGTVQSHRNVLHDIMHYTNSAHFCADDCFVLLSSVSFADSVRTIYASLLNSAVLCPFDVRRDGLEALAQWMVDERITIYRSVPTLFRHFVRSFAGSATFPDLRLIYLGGEAVQRVDIDLYKRSFPPSCVLVNRFGTTETFTCRYYFVDHGTDVTAGTVPVGYEVPDKEVVLLDDGGEPVEAGAIGEMAVRSRYLSPGFWRNPDSTRASFVEDNADRRLRMYRTGDLGRFRPDGCLEYLGRKDFQVKIRGHRIETAEIEAALLGLTTIREAVVAAEQGETHDRLVAYVVPAATPAPGPSTLRTFLAQHLPDYMVPSTFVVLDTLPLLPNGKVNRRGLPKPGNARPELDEPFVGPRHPVEEEIAGMWGDVLGLDAVGINDSFLDLGGDSLAATRVVARVRDRFGLSVSLAALWKAPTVAEMAAIVTAHLGTDAGSPDAKN